jgi:branched-chain amino acid transport system ATP-binding protein
MSLILQTMEVAMSDLNGSGTVPLIEVEGLIAGYRDLRAVWDVSLSVYPGKTTVLLGSNGAGKTTTLHAIIGLVKTFGGSIKVDGEDVGDLPTYDRVRRGVALVQEGKRVFKDCTVEQNLLLGGWCLPRPRRRQMTGAIEKAYERFPVLASRRKHLAGSLSGGQQQILAISQALVPEPRALLLDEPSAGLAPIVLQEILSTINSLRDEGLGILLVEQLVDAALSVADHVSVIALGRSVFSRPLEHIEDRQVIRDAYIGLA